MEIKDATSTRGPSATLTKAPAEAVERCLASDRVSTLDVHRAADVARGAQAKAGELRLVRLAHIGEAIRSGNYHPSASEVASRLLDAAEIDQHLKAALSSQ